MLHPRAVRPCHQCLRRVVLGEEILGIHALEGRVLGCGDVGRALGEHALAHRVVPARRARPVKVVKRKKGARQRDARRRGSIAPVGPRVEEREAEHHALDLADVALGRGTHGDAAEGTVLLCVDSVCLRFKARWPVRLVDGRVRHVQIDAPPIHLRDVGVVDALRSGKVGAHAAEVGVDHKSLSKADGHHIGLRDARRAVGEAAHVALRVGGHEGREEQQLRPPHVFFSLQGRAVPRCGRWYSILWGPSLVDGVRRPLSVRDQEEKSRRQTKQAAAVTPGPLTDKSASRYTNVSPTHIHIA